MFKRLIAGIIVGALLCGSAFASSLNFGLNRTYDWSSSYWSTRTNVQDTYCTITNNVRNQDGWTLLSLATPTNIISWDSLTGWTNTVDAGCTVEVSPSGQLHEVSGGNAAAGQADSYRNLTYPSGNHTVFNLSKFDALSASTVTTLDLGAIMVDYGISTSKTMNETIRTNGSNFVLYHQAATGAVWKLYTTDVPVDTSRFHLWGTQGDTGSNTGKLYFDGKVQAAALTYYNGTIVGYLEFTTKKRKSIDNPEWHNETTWHWNNLLPFTTSPGTLESDPNSAIFHAATGRRWSGIIFSTDTTSSTAVVVDVKCASSPSGLASAPYQTNVASGSNITTKDVYGEVRITLKGASSGAYTPILKTLSISDEASAGPTLTGSFGPLGFMRKRR